MSTLNERVYIMEHKQKLKEREQEKHKKEIEEIQRKKEQKMEQKQYEKDLLIACKEELEERFEEDFSWKGTRAKYNFYSVSVRNNIIKNIAKSKMECDYLEENYNKILNKMIKKYKLNEKYEEEKEKEEIICAIEKEQIEKEQESNVFQIIKWIVIIILAIIIVYC